MHEKTTVVLDGSAREDAADSAPAAELCAELIRDGSAVQIFPPRDIMRSGQPLAETNAMGLPTGHVMRALELAGSGLADGLAVPGEAAEMIAHPPIPNAPIHAWHQVFLQAAQDHWVKAAAANGFSPSQLLAEPYLEVESSCASRS